MGFRNKSGKREEYADFGNVETMRNFLIPEEFPDGAYGCSIRQEAPVELKSTPWEEGQRRYSAFNYEFKSMHQDLPREYPGAHPTHDDPDTNHEMPYTSP